MSIYYEVRSSSRPEGEGEQLEPSRYSTREDAEAAARRESAMGFFSQVWEVIERPTEKRGERGCLVGDYLCEYAPAEAA